MSLGSGGSLSTNRKEDPAGAGFITSANNGLSENPAGTVVFGQTQNTPGDPAILLNDRYIPLDGFAVTFQGNEPTPGNIERFEVGGGFQNIYGDFGATGLPVLNLTDLSTPLVFSMLMFTDGIGGRFGGLSDSISHLKFDPSTGQIWFTQNAGDAAPNIASVTVIGTFGCTLGLTGRRLVNAPVASPEILDQNFSRRMYTNEALANLDIDISSCAAGSEFVLASVQAGTVTATPAAGETITIAGTTGAAGAPATTIVPGSVITLVKYSANAWIAISFTGVWTV